MDAIDRLQQSETERRHQQKHAKRSVWNYCQANDLAWLAEYAGTLASHLNTRVTGGCCPVAEFGGNDPEEREYVEEV